MIVVGLMLSIAANKFTGRRVLVGILLLAVDEVRASRFQQAIDVEHENLRFEPF
jgi:hypothetical protein